MNQIQGASENASPLSFVNWPAAMVNIVEHVAVGGGAETLCIQSAANNCWVDLGMMRSERAEEIYDQTAVALGFDRGADMNWRKQLT